MVPTRKRNFEAMAQGTQSLTYNAKKKSSGLKTIVKSTDVCVEGVDRLTALPKDVTLNVLQYISQSDLYHCALVCRGLCAVTDDERLWKGIWEGVVLRREPSLKTYEDSQQLRDYKVLCKRAAVTKGKWKTGQEVTTFTKMICRNQCPVERVVISSHYILVTVGGLIPVSVFSCETGEYLHGLLGLFSYDVANGLTVSNDERMTVAYHGRVVCVWKLDTGELLHTFNHTDDVLNIAIQDKMLSSTTSGHVHVWSLASGRRMHQFSVPGSGERLLAMDHHLLAVYEKEHRRMWLWDIELGHQQMTQRWLGSEQCLNQILVDSATHSLVGIEQNTIRIWDTETSRHRGVVRAGVEHEYRHMLVQDQKLIIHSSFHHHAIIVVALEGRPSVLYCIDDGPVNIQRGHTTMTTARHRPSNPWSQYIMKVVSSELLVVTSEQDHCVYLFDVKGRRFVRKMDEGQGRIVGLNVSYAKLQVVRKATDDSDNLTYVSYDFGGQ